MDLYRTLGLTPAADANAIRTAYRSLAKKYHPDVSTLPDAHERFLAIAEAYEVLSDPATRARYDRTRQRAAARQEQPRQGSAPRGTSSHGRYDRTYSKRRHEARARAEAYGRMRYEEFDANAFKAVAGYYGPKMLGCVGVGAVVLLLLFCLAFLAGDNEWVAIPVIILGLFGFMPAMAYGSTLFDAWHDQQRAARRRKR